MTTVPGRDLDGMGAAWHVSTGTLVFFKLSGTEYAEEDSEKEEEEEIDRTAEGRREEADKVVFEHFREAEIRHFP